MTVFWKAFAWTAIPIVALSIVSTAAAVGDFGSAFWLGFYLVYGAAGVWLVATIAMTIAIVVLYARGTGERASGILAGIGVGVLALGTTGPVNLATIVATFQ